MNFNWIKRFLPRGLYGRAALILILPIVTIQFVVSITFIQRHYEAVTRQMAQNIIIEVSLIVDRVNMSADAGQAMTTARDLGEALSLTVASPTPASSGTGDIRSTFDLSGRALIDALRTALPDLLSIDLSHPRLAEMTVATDHGPMAITFDRRRVSATNPHQLLVLMVATGVLMTLIAILFLRNQLRPIRRLARASEAFGKGRILPYKPTGALEVRAAGNAFLDMRARIERQIEQRMLLLSGVSHDLRTPLTRLRLGLTMLGEDAEIADMVRDIDEMQQLLDAFLAFVRDDATDEEPESLDPVALVRSVVEDSRRSGQDVTFRETSSKGLASLRAAAIRRALDNLLGNAARYGTRAEVSLEMLERSLRISVEDDGPGIARERRGEAMQPFTRLDAARNQDGGSGVGLGLAITADIARQHGGTLRLGESQRLGGLKADLILAR